MFGKRTNREKTIPITGMTTEECRQRGRDASGVAVRHEGIWNDPAYREVETQGAEEELASLSDSAEKVNKARTALAAAREPRRMSEPDLLLTARSLVRAAFDRDRFRRATGDSGWFAESDLPTPALLLLLLAIAVGEWVFNRAAFVVTGEDALSIDILAATMGIGLVCAAHLGGSAARRLLDDHVRSHGMKLAGALGATVVLACLLGVGGITVLRTAFFSEVAPDLPSTGMVLLQVFLLLVAVAASMVHASPSARTERELDAAFDDAYDEFEAARKKWLDLRAKEREGEATLRSELVRATATAGIQSLQTSRELAAFTEGVQASAGVPVSAPIVSVVRHREIGRWETWLDEHPFDEDADLIDELEALLAQVNGLDEVLADREQQDPKLQEPSGESSTTVEPEDDWSATDDRGSDELDGRLHAVDLPVAGNGAHVR